MAERNRSRRIGRAIAMMIAFGVALGWASVFAISFAVEHGMSERSANRIPFFGFGAGLALGYGVHRSRDVKEAVGYVAAPLILGAVGWVIGLAGGALFLLFGVSEDGADLVPTIGFGAGIALGMVITFAGGAHLIEKLKR